MPDCQWISWLWFVGTSIDSTVIRQPWQLRSRGQKLLFVVPKEGLSSIVGPWGSL